MGGCERRRGEERTEVSGFQQKCRMCRSLLLPVGFGFGPVGNESERGAKRGARTRTGAFLRTQHI